MSIKAILADQGGSGVTNPETTDNKVTSLSSSSTDTQYPSAKAVYDELQYIGESNVIVSQEFTNPLNTDQLTLGQHDVYFTAYPDIKWCVDHLDGNYAYLGLYNATEETPFGSNVNYSGSTIATKCTTYLNNTIPNVADYLENVTVHGVTSKVFIPSNKMFSGTASSGGGDANDPTFDYPSASADNRKACIANWNSFSYFWLSSPYNSGRVLLVNSYGNFDDGYMSYSYGFRPEVKVQYKGTKPTMKVLNTALDDIGTEIGIVKTSINAKQDVLTFDTTPTSGSMNPVTSDGIYTEISTLKTSVSEGKAAVASAITDKGVSTASDASFSTMATNIGSINTRTDGTLDSNDKLLSGYTAYGNAGTKYIGSIITYAGGIKWSSFDWGDEDEEADAQWFTILKEYLADNPALQLWIGKTKKVTLTSSVLGTTLHKIICIGVNQDADNTVTFQTSNCLATTIAFSDSSDYANGSNYYHSANLIYDGNTSGACKAYYNAFPGKASIKQLRKGTCVTRVSDKNGTATYQNQYVWIPSEGEVGLDSYASLTYSNWTTTNGECTYGKKFQYSYYTDNSKRIKKLGDSGSASSWWTRSHASAYSSFDCAVNSDGTGHNPSYNNARGVAPAFCIGN